MNFMRKMRRMTAPLLCAAMAVSLVPSAGAESASEASAAETTSVTFYSGAGKNETLYRLDGVSATGAAKIQKKEDAVNSVTQMLTVTGELASVGDTKYSYVLYDGTNTYYAIPDPKTEDNNGFKDWFGTDTANPGSIQITGTNNEFYPRYTDSTYYVNVIYTYSGMVTAAETSVNLVKLSDKELEVPLPDSLKGSNLEAKLDDSLNGCDDYVKLENGKVTVTLSDAFLAAVQGNSAVFTPSQNDAAAGTIAIRVNYVFPKKGAEYEVHIYKQNATDAAHAVPTYDDNYETVKLTALSPIVDLTQINANAEDRRTLTQYYDPDEFVLDRDASVYKQQVVNADGSTVIDLYYNRAIYTISADAYGGSNEAGISDHYDVLYGADIESTVKDIWKSTPTRVNNSSGENYLETKFVDWRWSYELDGHLHASICALNDKYGEDGHDKQIKRLIDSTGGKMPAADITFTAHWHSGTVPVTVVYMAQNANDDNYTTIGHKVVNIAQGFRILNYQNEYEVNNAANAQDPIAWTESYEGGLKAEYPLDIKADAALHDDGQFDIYVTGSIGEITEIFMSSTGLAGTKIGQQQDITGTVDAADGGLKVTVSVTVTKDENGSLSPVIKDVVIELVNTNTRIGKRYSSFASERTEASKNTERYIGSAVGTLKVPDKELGEIVPLIWDEEVVGEEYYNDRGFYSFAYCDAYQNEDGSLKAPGDVTVASGSGNTYVYVYYTRNYYALQFHPARYNNNTFDLAKSTNSRSGYISGKGSYDWTKDTYGTNTNQIVSTSTAPILKASDVNYQTNQNYTNEYTIVARYGANIADYWPEITESRSNLYFFTWHTNHDTPYHSSRDNSNIIGVYGTLDKDIIVQNGTDSTTSKPVTFDINNGKNTNGSVMVMASGDADSNGISDLGYKHDLVGYWWGEDLSRNYHFYYESFDGDNETGKDTATLSNWSSTTQQDDKGTIHNVARISMDHSTNGSKTLKGVNSFQPKEEDKEQSLKFYLHNTQSSVRSSKESYGQNAPQIAGYTLYYAGYEEGDSNANKKNGVDIYCFYRPNRHTITYQSYSGQPEDERDKETVIANTTKIDNTFNKQAKSPGKTPYGNDYDWGGWYLDGNFNRKVTFSGLTIANDYTFYGKWELPKFSVKFNMNGFEFSSEQTQLWKDAGYTVDTTDDTVTVRGIEEGTHASELFYGTFAPNNDVNFSHWAQEGESHSYGFGTADYVTADIELEAVAEADGTATYTKNYLTAERPETDAEMVTIDGKIYYKLDEPETVTTTGLGSIGVEADKAFEGYLVTDPIQTIYLEPGDEKTVNFIYEKFTNTTYCVHYIAAGDTEFDRNHALDAGYPRLAPDKTVTVESTSQITETAVEIPGYSPSIWQQTMALAADGSSNHIYFYYHPNTRDAKLTVNYYFMGDDGKYIETDNADAPYFGSGAYRITVSGGAAPGLSLSRSAAVSAPENIIGAVQNGTGTVYSTSGSSHPDMSGILAALQTAIAGRVLDSEKSSDIIVHLGTGSEENVFNVYLKKAPDDVCYILHKDGTRTHYTSVNDALKAYTDGDYKIVMIKNTVENVDTSNSELDDIYLDFSGYTVTGSFTIAEGDTLYGIDTRTDKFGTDYEESETSYGGIIGAVTGSGTLASSSADASKEGMYTYVKSDNGDGYSFHRVYSNLWLISLILSGESIDYGYGAAYYADDMGWSVVTAGNNLPQMEADGGGMTYNRGKFGLANDNVELGNAKSWEAFSINVSKTSWNEIIKDRTVTPYVLDADKKHVSGKSNAVLQRGEAADGYSLFEAIVMFVERSKNDAAPVDGVSGDTNSSNNASDAYVTYSDADILKLKNWLVEAYKQANPGIETITYDEVVAAVRK